MPTNGSSNKPIKNKIKLLKLKPFRKMNISSKNPMSNTVGGNKTALMPEKTPIKNKIHLFSGLLSYASTLHNKRDETNREAVIFTSVSMPENTKTQGRKYHKATPVISVSGLKLKYCRQTAKLTKNKITVEMTSQSE